MDNLTHSLVGALLGQMGLKRKTGLAMPTLIIAANIPDIDAVAVLLGGQQHLAIRRGITHGPIAMVLLPLLLWAAMLWFDAWQTKRGKRPEKRLPVHKGWLLALAIIGCLSHPLFDWFNSYGIRLLEPFSSQWFYGDTLFIIDVWIWAALIVGLWLSVHRERKEHRDWHRPARISFLLVCSYILFNGFITTTAETVAKSSHYKWGIEKVTKVVANPVPIQFWKRDMVIQIDGFSYYLVPFALFSGLGDRPTKTMEMIITDKVVHELDFGNPQLNDFLFWSRLPYLDFESEECLLPCPPDFSKPTVARVRDARFSDLLVTDRFSVSVVIPPLEDDLTVE